MISYDDFAKLEITIGDIRAVDVVNGADKLLKLTVDFGEKRSRQIISGIRTFFDDPQVLVGKKCPFLANLAHRTLRGLESEGMLLAAHHEGEKARGAFSRPCELFCERSGAKEPQGVQHRYGGFALLLPSNDLPAGTRVI